MSRRSLYSFVSLVLVLSCPDLSSAQELVSVALVGERAHADCRTLPANIEAGSAGRALVLAVASMSDTFRRQCAVVARAPGLQIVLHLVGRIPVSTARATTEIWRNASNTLTAVMQVPVSRDSAELLAHEFEHVVEQLDGVCLRAMFEQNEAGVSQGPSGAYETFRAKTIGRQVAAEVAATVERRRLLRASTATPAPVVASRGDSSALMEPALP